MGITAMLLYLNLLYSVKTIILGSKNILSYIFPTGKMTVFGVIFKFNSRIGKLWDLLGNLRYG